MTYLALGSMVAAVITFVYLVRREHIPALISTRSRASNLDAVEGAVARAGERLIRGEISEAEFDRIESIIRS